MAFASKIGSLFKRAATTSNSSVFQAIRCMSSSRLFIGGLSYNTDEPSLREAFVNHGEVVDARVIIDRETGRSKGFGFVTFTSPEEASTALSAMNGKDLHGRVITVNYAHDRQRSFTGNGGGNYGGEGGSGGYMSGQGNYDGGAGVGGGYGSSNSYNGNGGGNGYGGNSYSTGGSEYGTRTGDNYDGAIGFGGSGGGGNYPVGGGGGNYPVGGGGGNSEISNAPNSFDGSGAVGYGNGSNQYSTNMGTANGYDGRGSMGNAGGSGNVSQDDLLGGSFQEGAR